MTKESLFLRLQELGLGEAVDYLMAASIECCTMQYSALDGSALRRSQIGGKPDVPSGFVWPVSSGAAQGPKRQYDEAQYEPGPLRFIAQINLEEVPVSRDVLPLPVGGILYFFSAVQKVDFPHTGSATDDWSVFWWDGSGDTHKAEPEVITPEFRRHFENVAGPIDLAFFHPKALAIEFQPYVQVDIGGSVLPPLVREEICPILMKEFWNEQLHLIGGRPVELQSPIHGCGDYRPQPAWNGLDLRARRVARELDDDDWIQLAQFTSDLDTGVCWPYLARAFFMIRKQNLVERRFDQTVQVTQI